MSSPDEPARAQLLDIFRAALAAVDGERVVRDAMRCSRAGVVVADRTFPADVRLHMIAVGKAAATMAAAFEAVAGERLSTGLVVTKAGQGVALARSSLIEAAHPVPDASCVAAAGAVEAALAAAAPEDVVCVLLSGGTSSLLASPLAGLSLDDLAATTQLLLESGADIHQTNTVRKQLTRASGGRLSRHCRAREIVVLAISDVPGDTVDVIGSGPFAGDASSPSAALNVLSDLGLEARVPTAVRRQLASPDSHDPVVRRGDASLRGVHHRVLASNRTALTAGRAAALRLGAEVRVLSPQLEGEARDVGRMLAEIAGRAAPARQTFLLAGGETYVRVQGSGRGGRNQELALSAALALEGSSGITLLAAGTDGTDGTTPAAGAFADGGTTGRAAAAGVAAREALEANDAFGFFSAEGGLLETGPTGTNVMDLAMVAIDPVAP